MDIPFEKLKKYESIYSEPKIVSPEYIVGIFDVSKE